MVIEVLIISVKEGSPGTVAPCEKPTKAKRKKMKMGSSLDLTQVSVLLRRRWKVRIWRVMSAALRGEL